MNKGFLVAIALMTLLACGGGGGGNSSSGSSTPTPPVTPTAPQIVTQPSSATVQAGSTVVFLVATNVTDATYQWFKNSAAISGGTSATYSFTAALTDNGDTFYVNVTNAAGTVTSSVATLTVTSIPPVQTAPVITAEPSSTTVTVGSAATFSVTATASEAMTYQWFKNSAAIPGAIAATYSYTPAITDNGATFYVTVTDTVGSVTSSYVTLTVNAVAPPPPVVNPPVITTQPINATVTVGSAATFNVVASSTVSMTYQWFKNSSIINGATSSSYTYTPAITDNGATFDVLVGNSAGSVTSSTVTLTVNAVVPPPLGAPVFTVNPSSQTNIAGTVVTFTASATNSPTYQWFKNGSAVNGATSTSYSFTTLYSDNNDTIYVAATNATATTNSATATLTVPQLPIINQQPSSISGLTLGSSANFSVAYSSATPTTFQWFKNGAAISGATASAYSYTPVLTDSGSTFYVILTNTGGSVTSTTATLTINTPPATPDLTIGKVILTQGSQKDDGSEPMIPNRPAVFIAWPISSTGNMLSAQKVDTVVYVYNSTGSLVFTSTDNYKTSPGGSLPNFSTVTTYGVTYSWIPAAYMQPGNTYTVVLNGDHLITESDYTNNIWPVGGSTTSAANSYAPTWTAQLAQQTVVLVPTQVNMGTGTINLVADTNNVTDYLPWANPSVSAQTTVWTPTDDVVTDSGFLTSIFTGLKTKRLAENPTAHYYAVLPLGIGTSWSGLSTLGNPTNTNNRESIGIDGGSTLPHELGHQLGFDHAPCGPVSTSSIDPGFVAYNAAGLTMTHFASVTHQFDNSYTGPAGAELMSYCSPLGLGSWFWETARNGLVPTASASTASLSADMAIQSNNQSLTPDMRRNVLLITGKKTSEGYTMNPVMTVKSIPTDAYSLLNTRDPKTEWLTVEFVNKKNTVIFTTKIDVTKFEDIDTEEAIFGATTDMPSEPLSAIVLKDSTGKEVARVTDKPHTQAPTISYIDRTSKFIHTGTSQMVMVQDPETFEVLSMVQGEGQMHRFNHKEGQKFNILTSTGLTTTQTVGQ